ncbi:MAG: response regulator [Gammaproteobacteria bacterium]
MRSIIVNNHLDVRNFEGDLPSWPHILARTSALLSISVGAVTVLSWIFYFWLPDKFLLITTAIQPNAGLCFILIGCALWLCSEKRSGYVKYLIDFSCGVVFLLSFLTLLEYFFNADYGVDEGVFKKILSAASATPKMGRMSPFAANNFILLSFTLFFLDNKVIRYGVHQFFAVIVILYSYFQLLGLIYGMGALAEAFGISSKHYSVIGMPLVTTFLVLGLGVLFIRPFQGISGVLVSKESGGMLVRRIIPPAFILPIVFGYLELQSEVGGEASGLRIALLIMTITIFFTSLILLNAYFSNRSDLFRQKAEFAMRQSKRQLQAILDHTTAMITIYDKDGKCLLANKQLEKLLGFGSYELVGRLISDFYPKEWSDKLLADNLEVLKTRKAISVEESYQVGGQSLSFITNKFPLYNEEGSPYAICSISTEVSEINKMHEDLRKESERLAIALQSAEAGTWDWDIKNDVVTWDDYLLNVFGIRKDSAPKCYDSIFNYIHPDDRQQIGNGIKKILIKGDDYHSEFRIIRSDHSVHILSAKGHIYRNESQEPIRMSGICWDVTQHKRVEEDLRRAKKMAESLADQAKAANFAKSAFLASMSHEVRTPLNGVLGMTDILMETSLSEEQSEAVQMIKTSGKALLSIINDILDFSKIDSGHMTLESIDFDLYALIENAIDMFAVPVHKKGVALGAYINADVPRWVRGDPDRIRQVLLNILSNAAKFTEQGEIGVKVLLDKKNTKENKITLLFEVADTGIGISPEVSAKLFQPFSQGDVSVSRKYGGTGLGLVISKRIVEMMGGDIHIESFPGRGSKFIFKINVGAAAVNIPLMEYGAIKGFEGTRILCVDDNAINRYFMGKHLASWQLRCDMAVNAADALSMLEKAVLDKDPYALMIVDHAMPGMTGLELVQVMRRLDEISDTPVIMLSTFASDMSEEMEKLNIAVMLPKPLHTNKLYASVVGVLKKTNTTMQPVKELSHLVEKKLPNKNQKYRLLLAEDNIINQKVALKILEKLGFTADVVANGVEVLQAINEKPYDLILMDCQMPEMDGYRASSKIRKLEKKTKKHIIIVAMTANALKEDREKCLQAGMDDYMSKPIDISMLDAVLDKHLSTLLQTPESVDADADAGQAIPLIDDKRMHAIFGDDVLAIKKFIHVFIESSDVLINEIDQAIKAKNAILAKELVHRLKGSASNSGVLGLAQLSADIEQKIITLEWGKIEEDHKKLLVLLDQLKQFGCS